ncbi:hypothetical protein FIBSPDRAFT_81985 [Athelia psychrophila]|uniref:Uncharacterized protein n=1 Tax=Athelia psychrophila TaxID=1759441 RepID=A0A166E6I1_9AGAM|nr:hypothetical protein FIBSPDRAFT_81985 [Fibularhizoctonia sp. CBS 109695]
MPVCPTWRLQVPIPNLHDHFMALNFQSLSLKDSSNTAASANETRWQLDPDFTAQIDRVARVLIVDDITDTILATSGLLEIFSFRRTCRLGRRAVDSYNSRAFNVNRNLLRFFDDPESFRALQEQTDTLISGSFALALLDRTIYPESDLDLYTQPGFAPTVAEWLYEAGYRLVRRNTDGDPDQGAAAPIHGADLNWRELVVDNWHGLRPPYGSVPAEEDTIPGKHPYDELSRNIHNVYTWKKRTNGRIQKVEIISCNKSPLATILQYHSTVVQNFISHSATYSLYPQATFVHRLGAPLEPRNNHHESALEKYRARGWTIKNDGTQHHSGRGREGRIFSRMFQPYRPRSVGDAYSWCLPDFCRTRSASSQKELVDASVANGFMLCPYDHLGYEMEYTMVTTPVLRFQYAIAGNTTLSVLPKKIAHQLDWHWRRHRRRLERLPLEERQKQWIWKDKWLQNKLSPNLRNE